MAFIPHTPEDIARMLEVIGARSIDDLFDEIPADLRAGVLNVPAPLSEMEIARLMTERAAIDGRPLNFIGAGAYEHHIPAPVWAIATRGEFYSAYTPYQAEASQGTLQLIYEYQSMMCALTGMEVSNASLYDGASALAEACLMAVRSNRASNSRRILMPRAVNPTYAQVAQAIAGNQDISFVPVDFDRSTGRTLLEALKPHSGQDFTALVLQQPNFFGSLEEVDALTDWAHDNKIMLIAVVNPTSLALLKPPGEWGAVLGRRARRRHRLRRGAGARRAAVLGRSLFRLHGDSHAVRASDAGTNRRRHRGCGGQTGIHPDAAGARAAHTPQQSHLQHLHQSGFDGDGGDHLHESVGAARLGSGCASQHAANLRSGQRT